MAKEYVEREAAYNAIVQNYTTDAQLRDLDAIPAADVSEVRHGRWIEDGYYGEPCVCSNCGEPCKDTVMGKPRWNYCPMCGARCDGGPDE